MKNAHVFVLYTLSLVLAGLAASCGSPDDRFDSGETMPTGQSASPIKGGTPATAYPESALLALYDGFGNQPSSFCSGSVIAPKVVLTAGHCVDGYTKWTVAAPYAGGQEILTTDATTYDYQGNGQMVNPNQHDVGLIFLDTPIDLPAYPLIVQSKLPNSSQVLNIGRIKDGMLSHTQLFVSQPVSIKDGVDVGFDFDYYATEVIEPGDSGGPVVLPGALPHTIVAVNSGGGQGIELLARVDLLYSWIQDQIQSHGGPGGEGGAGGGGGGGGIPIPPPPPPSTCEHDPCELGPKMSTDCSPCVSQVCAQDAYCCQNKWDDRCVEEADSLCGLSCGGGGGQMCAHDPCQPGQKLAGDCDSCVAQICSQDAFCCNVAWDMMCKFEVQSICGLSCN